VGAISLLVLAICLFAIYGKHLQGSWRSVYIVTAVIALYLNMFVLVVQLFTKTPPIAAIAASPKDVPFALTQALVLVIFVWLGRSALRAFKAGKPGL